MTSRLIVYEPKPSRAPVLSRCTTLPRQDVRSLAQAQHAIELAPSSIVAFEVQPHRLTELLRFAQRVKIQFPVALIAMPHRELQGCAALFFEAGCDVVLWSNLDLPLVTRLVHRHERLLERDREEASGTAREQVWQRLPWKRQAAGGGSSQEKGNNGVSAS